MIAEIARSNIRQTQLLSSMRKDVVHPELMLKKLPKLAMLAHPVVHYDPITSATELEPNMKDEMVSLIYRLSRSARG